MTLKVGIVGGSIAGSVAARAFQKLGASIHWFDLVRPQPQGAVYLWTNALKALATLDLAAPVIRAGVVQHTMEFRSWEGELLWPMPVAELGAKHGAPCVLIDRQRLLDTLRELTGGPANKPLWRAQPLDAGVELLFRDGSTTRVDLLVAADGRDSPIREQLFGRSTWRNLSQYWAFGYSRIPRPEPGLSSITLGLGRRLWVSPMEDGRCYWGAAVSAARHHELCGLELEAALAQAFAGAHPPIETVLANISHPVGWIAIEDRPVRQQWTSGRTALIGDAAHLMTPDLGQGACMGIEDAVSLATVVETHGPVEGPALWERRRRARVAWITELSRSVAKAADPGGVFASRVRDQVIRRLMPPVSLREMDRLLCYSTLTS